MDDEALRQKWQPVASKATGNMARSNFQIGQNKVFTDKTSARADYGAPADGISNEVTMQRIAMVQELRKSHLPAGNAKVPATTSQDHYKSTMNPAQEALAA